MFVVDIEKGVFIEDQEIKESIVTQKPYKKWLDGMIYISDLPDPIRPPKTWRRDIAKFQRAFGYTEEELKEHIIPMVLNGQEPVGSMGNDTPMAILSKAPKNLFNYSQKMILWIAFSVPADIYSASKHNQI